MRKPKRELKVGDRVKFFTNNSSGWDTKEGTLKFTRQSEKWLYGTVLDTAYDELSDPSARVLLIKSDIPHFGVQHFVKHAIEVVLLKPPRYRFVRECIRYDHHVVTSCSSALNYRCPQCVLLRVKVVQYEPKS